MTDDTEAVEVPSPLPATVDEAVAELETFGEDQVGRRRRIHQMIRLLGEVSAETQQAYRDVICPEYMRPGDWKSALSEAKRTVRNARKAPPNSQRDDDRDDGPPPADGAEVLDAVSGWIGPYLALPSEHYLTALTLWAAHSHCATAFYVTPRLVLDSAEPSSGKTRVLELLNLIVRRPEMILSPTTAAIFRMLADGPLTLLFDEVDTIFDPRTGGNYEDLRALLNAGYKRGSTIPRCVGDAAKMQVQRFKVFAPTALAGLAGNMPATILTRAVVLHMRKRPANQKIKAFSERDAEQEAEPLRTTLGRWVRSQAAGLSIARPKMPDGVEDRPAEVWEALLAIADAADGGWPDRARAACEYFVLKTGTGAESFGVRLLGDLRRIFGEAEALPTVEVLDRLVKLDESPWADLRGKPLDARRLAKELKRYEVTPVPFRDPFGKTVKGYTTYAADTKENATAGLADAWSRYLSAQAGSPGNRGNEGNGAGQGDGQNGSPEVTRVTGVTPQDLVTPVGVTEPLKVTAGTALTSGVTPVTPVTPSNGRCGYCEQDREVRRTPAGNLLCLTCDIATNRSNPERRVWPDPLCFVCGCPIDPAVGEIHPNCDQGPA